MRGSMQYSSSSAAATAARLARALAVMGNGSSSSRNYGLLAARPTKMVMLSVSLDCPKCVRKVRKALRRVYGVHQVSADMENNRVVVTGAGVDGHHLVRVIGSKTRKRAEVVYEEEVRDGHRGGEQWGDWLQGKVVDEGDGGFCSTKKVVVLQVNCNRPDSVRKARQLVRAVKGVEDVSVDMKSRQVTVTGDMDMVDVLSVIRARIDADVKVVSTDDVDDGYDSQYWTNWQPPPAPNGSGYPQQPYPHYPPPSCGYPQQSYPRYPPDPSYYYVEEESPTCAIM